MHEGGYKKCSQKGLTRGLLHNIFLLVQATHQPENTMKKTATIVLFALAAIYGLVPSDSGATASAAQQQTQELAEQLNDF